MIGNASIYQQEDQCWQESAQASPPQEVYGLFVVPIKPCPPTGRPPVLHVSFRLSIYKPQETQPGAPGGGVTAVRGSNSVKPVPSISKKCSPPKNRFREDPEGFLGAELI